jgi:Ca-activated chloride channel homolog
MKKFAMVAILVILTAILALNSCGSSSSTTHTTSTGTKYSTTSTHPTYTSTTRPSTTQSTYTMTTTTRPTTTGTSPTIGFSVGGAKDINNFRENIKNNYLPLPTDVSYEGLFYDYYFDTGVPQETNKLFAPAYSYAVTRDPLSQKTEYYLSVGLNSNIRQEDFQRKTLNLVIVIDSSGSMGEFYDEYYYDELGNHRETYDGEGTRLNKLQSAQKAVTSILDQLEYEDRVAIVQFNSNSNLVKSIGLVGKANMNSVKGNVNDIQPGGSTNLFAGIDMATDQLWKFVEADSYEYENRIIVLTDAQPNTGEYSSSGLQDIVQRNAQDRIYTTFIGIGVDFNTELINVLTQVRGANYYSVRSPREFRHRVDDEFDYMVTPMVFNVNLMFVSDDWKIDTVFGSPEADSSTGRLMSINTLFPAKSSEGGEVKGGIVLLKLRKTSSNAETPIYLRASYEDRDGRKDSVEQVIVLEKTFPEYFDNTGIRKAILLTRYAALLKNWMADERQHYQYTSYWDSCISEDTGIVIPREIGLSEWERQSIPLRISGRYTWIFKQFATYFKAEIAAIEDYDLDQELGILNRLY